MSPTCPVRGDRAGLIETVVSFDWRFWASLLGVTFAIPPSMLLLSSVTLVFGPTIAWLAWEAMPHRATHFPTPESPPRPGPGLPVDPGRV
jgi:hypothetical protein